MAPGEGTLDAPEHRLVVIRHAKAEPKVLNAGGDHGRELLPRGERDAAALGRWLIGQGLRPDLALVSTAARARQTLAEALGAEEAETWPTRRIYDGGVDGVIEAVGEVSEEVRTLWVVGHEPVMSALAWDLADPEQLTAELHEGMSSGMPTATAVVLDLPVRWDEIGMQCARVTARHTGRAD